MFIALAPHQTFAGGAGGLNDFALRSTDAVVGAATTNMSLRWRENPKRSRSSMPPLPAHVINVREFVEIRAKPGPLACGVVLSEPVAVYKRINVSCSI